MKRLAVLLKPENVREVISLINELNLEATIYDVKGVTKGMERVASGRGSTTSEVSYNSRKVVATVINSEHVEEVVSRLKGALSGNKVCCYDFRRRRSSDDLILSTNLRG